MTSRQSPIDPSQLGARLAALEGVPALRAALAGERAFLVGGAVRDLLLGAGRADLDLAVEGDVIPLAARLGGKGRVHERFGTASVTVEGVRVDLASARTERYQRPGALPTVEPAGLNADLARRDFTINAMAVALGGEPELIDPHGGLDDLRAGLVRVLHPGSFVDDPTRALRAARYCARLGFELEAETARLLALTDLTTVSDDRIEAELRRLVAEAGAPAALALLADWRLADIDAGAASRVQAARELLRDPEWARLMPLNEALLAAALPDPELEAAALRLASAKPARPSEAVALTRGRAPVELLAARAAGGAWLDDYVREWRKVALCIDGADLLAAGVPEGPAIGRGLAAALGAKLDGEVDGRDAELRVAIAAAA